MRQPNPTQAMLRNVRAAAEYAAAYERAYGRKPYITFENGWFTVGKWPSQTKCRLNELKLMAARITGRGAESDGGAK